MQIVYFRSSEGVQKWCPEVQSEATNIKVQKKVQRPISKGLDFWTVWTFDCRHRGQFAGKSVKRVVGIDLSLTSAGLAILTETSRGVVLHTEVFKSAAVKTGAPDRKSKGRPTLTLNDRYLRMRDHSQTIIHNAASAELVVIEGLIGGPGGGVQDRTALWWIVVGACLRRCTPVAVASPTAMKRVIVGPRPKGSGPVDKVEVALAVAKLWPNATLGNNDACDAAGLAHCGAVALGWDVPTLERHRTMVWTYWPEFAPVREVT